ncbi:unnamed protein product [Tetraodon nigroviridis]|uniref:(spotted green pufferfish) hypothetical protein n=1 Tax=Tetraodon nigroviridis TaxID=99883 RepID=Q4S8P2_TETNG|nr:unnamed protein product [Tetraodon nigroviridis]
MGNEQTSMCENQPERTKPRKEMSAAELGLLKLCVCVPASHLLLISFLGYPNIVATYGRGYTGFAPSYSYQFPGLSNCLLLGGKKGVDMDNKAL